MNPFSLLDTHVAFIICLIVESTYTNYYLEKMTRTSVLADALNSINNAEKTGKRQVLIRKRSS